ncbi:MAG: HNH endonuclease [Verrucomicrobia bacterium]|nr:MAG: HNH endonuclease [Verrucomicrobiota bacterium]TAE88930.1 MAG: HNH endonuclease [Verrucomicrobiota bacterium]TAF27346.1 MAG: HNH endonuclease [Verrucomicrobiota bacterium]TAF42363.1 MAG: HNH endonuclease [Verrucomicrobiota bacterium]
MEVFLDRPVLVLNRFWQPVQTCSVRRALKLLCLGHAQVLQSEGEDRFRTHDLASWVDHSASSPAGEVLHSVRLVIRLPKIIVLSFCERRPRMEVRFNRRNVFLRDQHTCQYCTRTFGEADLNLDHVTPRDKGGRTTWENIVTSCIRCNTRKANKLPHEANMHPLRRPRAPRWRPAFALQRGVGSDESWAPFLEPERMAAELGG